MMDTENDFNNILTNINNHTMNKSTIIILCMDGDKIYDILKNNNGKYLIEDNNEMIFELEALYDINKTNSSFYGNKINVKLRGTYGLEKGINENLVFINNLINQFEKKNLN